VITEWLHYTCSRLDARPLLHKCARSNAFPWYLLVPFAKVVVWWAATTMKMRKNDQSHCARVVARANKDSARALGRGTRSKNPRQSPPSAIHNWKPRILPPTHLRRRMGTAQSVSTLGDLEATRKRWSRHKLVIENWNITSLAGKEHELVEGSKRYPWMLLISHPLRVVVLTLQSWTMCGKSFTHSALSQQNLLRLRWGHLKALSWQTVLMNWSY